MAFRSSAQYSCFALVVRSPKISDEISLQTAVLYRRCGVIRPRGARIFRDEPIRPRPLTMLSDPAHEHATDHGSVLQYP